MRPPSPRRRLLATSLLLLLLLALPVVSSGAGAGQSPDPLVVVVNRRNPIDNITSSDLRRFVLGERSSWPDGRKVTVVMRPVDDPDRAVLLRQICRMSEQDYARHLLQAAFTGDAASGAKQLSTAAGVRRFIFNVPGAIGYLRASEVDESLKVLLLDNRQSSDPGYALRSEGR